MRTGRAHKLIPTTPGELLAALLLVILGSVLFGLLIGRFTNILYVLTSKERQRTEIHDMIASTMFYFKLPEDIQNRVTEYYDMITESSYFYDKKAFDSLNHAQQDQIMLLKAQETIAQISLTNTHSDEHLKALVVNLEIESFQSGDIVLKQGEIGEKFYFIIDGLMEVILENKDYKYYEQSKVNMFYKKEHRVEVKSFKRMNGIRFENDDQQSFYNLIDLNNLIDKSDLSWSSFQEDKISSDIPSSNQYNIPVASESSDDINDHTKNFENFTVVNEYSKGKFFGEIS